MSDAWATVPLATAAVIALLAASQGRAWRESRWGRWRATVFLLGLAAVTAAVLGPLDRLGDDGLFTAHVAQHIILGDLAAPLLLLGLPARARQRLGAALAAIASPQARLPRALQLAFSPIGAAALWTLASYAWMVPTVHTAAASPGAVQAIDQTSFLLFGLLIWIGAFDPRPPTTLREGLRRGGMPWWARHGYAMSTRLTVMPLGIAIWLADPARYHDGDAIWPFALSAKDDQVLAASVHIGFEMLLFSVAIVLAFMFAIVADGHRRASEQGHANETPVP